MSGCRISAPAALGNDRILCSLVAIFAANGRNQAARRTLTDCLIHKENGHACSDVDRVLVLHDGGRDVLARIRTSRSR